MYVVIGSLAATENVFPPVPADTVVALGAFLSRFGLVSASVIYGVTWAANVTSAAAVYVAARTLGRGFFTGRIGRRLLRPKALERLERLYAKYGTWGIFLSRFVPGIRAVVPPFAGVAKLGAARTLIPAATASAIWYGAITITTVLVADHLGDVARLVAGANRVALILAGGFVVFAIVFAVIRRQLAGGGGRGRGNDGAEGSHPATEGRTPTPQRGRASSHGNATTGTSDLTGTKQP